MSYKFISLSKDEIEQRRHFLDKVGFQAWLTPILILTTIWIYRLLSSRLARSTAPSVTKGSKPPSTLLVVFRRISWTLNTTYVREFGPLHVQLLGLGYLSWLLYLTFLYTGEDYWHLTKSFGHVAVSQLPFHYLLSIKHPNNPITLVTRLHHERLNAYHRLLGRMIHGLLATHVVFYLRGFVMLGVLQKRIRDRDVRLGLIAFWSFNTIGILTIPPIRRKLYHKLFYRSHVFLSALVLPVLFFHVPYTRRYVLQTAVIWLLNGFLRRKASTQVKVSTKLLEDTDLVKVILEPVITLQSWDYVPGQHVYLTSPSVTGVGPKNPYTIADVNSTSAGTQVSLVVRALSGQTQYLKYLAQSKHSPTVQMHLEGPYGEAKEYIPRLLDLGRDSGQILLVAGGVGATYALPIYTALVAERASSIGVKFVWLVRDLSQAGWGISILNDEETGNVYDVEVYVTGETQVNNNTNSHDLDMLGKRGIKLAFAGKRPDIDAMADAFVGPQRIGEVVKRDSRKVQRDLTVLVCGPPGLSRDLHRAVGKHVVYGKEVIWHEEQFGFGGS